MTCTTCGAYVAAMERSCGNCGTDVLTAPRPSMPPAPLSEAPIAQAGRTPRKTKILTIATIVAIVLAGAIGVSRTQVANRLATSDAALRDTRGRLSASARQVDQLTAQVHQLTAAQDSFRSSLEEARAAEKDTRASLVACQQIFRLGASLVNGRHVSSSTQVQMASRLVSCFEGEVPPSLFP
jgi:hypothetical protein